jgi:hypothetical protein
MRVSSCADVCFIAPELRLGGIHNSACSPKRSEQVQRPGLGDHFELAYPQVAEVALVRVPTRTLTAAPTDDLVTSPAVASC